jgi:hypothetical protein
MARGRQKAGDAPQPPTTGNGNEATGTPANKLDAVRQALGELGKNAKPRDIQQHIKERHGIDMTLQHISTYKSSLRKKRRGRRGRKHRAEGEQAATPVRTRGGSSAQITLADLRALKELADRIGNTRLREIAELVS